MRIGIDAASLVGDKGGVGWHTHHLLNALLALEEDTDYVGYLRPGSLQGGGLGDWPRGSRMRWIETPRWLMPWRGRWDRLDLYHGPNFKMHTTGRSGPSSGVFPQIVGAGRFFPAGHRDGQAGAEGRDRV